MSWFLIFFSSLVPILLLILWSWRNPLGMPG